MINGSLFFILVIALVGAAIGFPSGPAPEKKGADADPIEFEDYPDPQPNPKHNHKLIPKPKKGVDADSIELEDYSDPQPNPGHNHKLIPKPKKGEGIFRQERESSQEFQIPHPIKPLPGYEQMPIPIRPGKPGVGPIIGRGSLSEPAYQDFQIPHIIVPIPNIEQMPIPVGPNKPIKGPGFVPNINEDPKPVPKVGS